MAVGAKPWHFLAQFLAEAMTLSMLGGMAGSSSVRFSRERRRAWTPSRRSGTNDACVREAARCVQRGRTGA
jgi:hypothetical protein